MRVYHNTKAELVQIFDERFYTKDGKDYYPSVTTILQAYPKPFLDQWFKEVGLNADAIRDKAAEKGSYVHNAIESFLLGDEIKFEEGRFEEWEMIEKFIQFYKKHVQKVITTEFSMVSKRMKIGGTLDLICIIDGVVWLIDFKTSNSISTTHETQQAVYQKLWNIGRKPEHVIERAGILHLRAKTRGEDKQGNKMQGKGWQVKPVTDTQKHLDLFKHLRKIWDHANPNYSPKDAMIPDRFSINQIELDEITAK